MYSGKAVPHINATHLRNGSSVASSCIISTSTLQLVRARDMDVLARIVSRPQAKPYRTKKLNETQQISLDKNGLLQWSQKDIENPKEWSKARRWYITLACIVLVMNASMSSSAPSACLEGITEEFGVSDTVGRLTVTLFVLVRRHKT